MLFSFSPKHYIIYYFFYLVISDTIAWYSNSGKIVLKRTDGMIFMLPVVMRMALLHYCLRFYREKNEKSGCENTVCTM